MKNEKSRRDPVKVLKKSTYILGTLQIILGVVFVALKTQAAITVFIMGIAWLLCGYLLSKNKISGIYLSWAGIVFGMIFSIYNGAILSIALLSFFVYWTYEAQKDSKDNR